MKQAGKAFWFLLSTIIRIIPFILLVMGHLFWSVFTFQTDPLSLLDPANIPQALGPSLWLYLVVGLILLAFLSLGYRPLAYGLFLGTFLGQMYYFLMQWNQIDQHRPPLLGLENRWFLIMLLGFLIGLFIQLLVSYLDPIRRQKAYHDLYPEEVLQREERSLPGSRAAVISEEKEKPFNKK